MVCKAMTKIAMTLLIGWVGTARRAHRRLKMILTYLLV